MRRLLRSLIPPGSLVFDIGSHEGALGTVYHQAGMRVVAVEPNPLCVKRIRARGIQVVQAAVTDSLGETTLYISDRWDATSTTSLRYMKTMAEWDASRYGNGNWEREEKAKTVTIDWLVERYGEPAYIKIDVEGAEESVLAGMSRQPKLLSFEFYNAYPEVWRACLERLSGRFNTVTKPLWGYHDKFDREEWFGKKELASYLESLNGDQPGDVFVIQ
jgi:FkbM family methyltransferase